jgi:hypothetical protein
MKEDDKYPKLVGWFCYMDYQFKKIDSSNNNRKLNDLLFDNNIDSVK